MTPINFAYWLQGFFEIAEEGEDQKQDAVTVSAAQSRTIGQHLDLCNEWSIGETLKPEVAKLLGTVGTIVRLSSGAQWEPSYVVIVRQDINAVFEHVIDPEMNDGKNAEKLSQLHSGNNAGYTLRC